MYERVTKKLIDKAMNKYLSPLISAYRQIHSSQHVLIRLLEEWKEDLNNNFVVLGVFMGFSKTFDCIPHDLSIAKLETSGFNDNLVQYTFFFIRTLKLKKALRCS